ncbi:MAG: relaxase/mobilization nuclease domain-containing protein [Mycoplasmataceae bacterium]|jgi:hypothetical protein|nr:relaxase/mobilization nuclease domain-containing protein [Mycoplasmataceae bacterium]
MISKHIPSNGDCFRIVSEYILQDNKKEDAWCVNCNADDMATAIIEIEATQELKPDLKNKTYHLTASFHNEDRKKLSLEVLKDIEKEMAAAIGYEQHQRIVATHIDKDHFHFHTVINKIHPMTLKNIYTWKEYYKLQKVMRKLEAKYDFKLETPRDHTLSRSSRDFESKTWEESFESYLKKPENLEVLTNIMDTSKTQTELRKRLADELGIGIKRSGNGLSFYDLNDPKITHKISGIDKDWSKDKVEEKFLEPWPESIFEGYLKDNKEEIIELANSSKGFKELRKKLAEKLGIGLRHWGTDLAFYDLNDHNPKGPFFIRTNDLEESLSKESLKEKYCEIFTDTALEEHLAENLEVLTNIMDTSKTWQEMHERLAKIGIKIRRSGGDLAFCDPLNTKVNSKIYYINKNWSKKVFEEKICKYQTYKRPRRRTPLFSKYINSAIWSAFVDNKKMCISWREYLLTAIGLDAKGQMMLSFYKKKLVDPLFSKKSNSYDKSF